MRIVLAGAPGSGKRQLAYAVQRHYLNDGSRPLLLISGPPDQFRTYATGRAADYRAELALATERAVDERDNIILVHSILDSMVYASYRLLTLAQHGGSNLDTERWFQTMTMIGQLTQDSFRHSLVFYVPYGGEDDFSQEIDKEFSGFFTRALVPRQYHLSIGRDRQIAECITKIDEYREGENVPIEGSDDPGLTKTGDSR